jgi:hypothetical protein
VLNNKENKNKVISNFFDMIAMDSYDDLNDKIIKMHDGRSELGEVLHK